MPMTSSDISGLLLAGLKTAFFGTFNEQPHQWDRISTLIPSEKDTEQYAWLGALPGINEFIDERKSQDLAEYEYAIKNKTWESTVSIDRAALEDDQYGQIAMRVKQMASTANQHLDQLTFGILEAGFAKACYDGTPMFNTAHPTGKLGKGVPQSNMGTDALNSASLQAAITQMMRFQDDQARPMGVIPDTLVVSPENYWEATTLLNSAFYPDPLATANQLLGINPLKGVLSLVSTPFLIDTNNWYLLDTKRVVKGVVLQMRKEFEFSALENNSETGFLRDVFMYGVRARYNAGFGDWRSAFGSNVA